MQVLVLGGTGSIGAPIVRELRRRGHRVLALARSDASARRLAALGATPLPGDLAMPSGWLPALPAVDGVIHAAAAFTDEDEAVERRLLGELLPSIASARRPPRFLYTGGCWLYGPTRGPATTEDSPFDPLPAFAWGVPHSRLVLGAPGLHAVVIHPAMVYEADGGVFRRFHADARERAAVRVVAGEDIHWPLVHSADLAVLYCLALEHSAPGESYLGAAIDGLAVGRIARAYARRYGTPRLQPEVVPLEAVAAELGEWARGYGLDQRHSGAKARRVLGWAPRHLDPLAEIAALP